MSRILFLFLLLTIGCTFPIKAQITIGGSTDTLGGDCYQLTDLNTFQGGYAYEQTAIDLNNGLDISFDVSLGDNDGGADGMVFVLRGSLSGTLIGTPGGSIGFEGSGFTSNTLGIEIDTWQNTELGDITADHLGIFQNAPVNHNAGNALTGPIPALPTSGNIEDGVPHSFRVTWDPVSDTMRVYFDCFLRITLGVDLIGVFNGDNLVHWGFLGTTGGAVNNQGFCGPFESSSLSNNLTAYLLCPGDSVQLEAGDPSLSYLWSPSTSLSDSTSNAPWASPDDSTTYVVLKILGCDTAYDTVDVNIFPFVLDLLSDTSICDDEFVIEGPVGAEFYLWNTGDTTPNITIDTSGYYNLVAASGVCIDTDYVYIEMAYLTSSFEDTVLCDGTVELSVYNPDGSTLWSTGDTIDSLGITSDGLYTVTLTLQECELTDSIDVRFRPVTIVPLSDTVFCQAETISVLQSGATGIFWSTGDTSQNLLVDSSGIYWVVARNDWCADTDSVSIGVEYFSLSDSILRFCDVEAYSVTASMPTALSYEWSNGVFGPTVTFDSTGIYSVTVRSASCEFRDSIDLTLGITPSFELGEDRLLCAGQEVRIGTETGTSSRRWSTGDTATYITVADTGVFILEASQEGCASADSIRVDFFPLSRDSFFIAPNVFTPNADGINDAFGMRFVAPELIREYSCEVYNRWGMSVFNATFANDLWDGALPSGDPATPGTYFYHARATTVCTDLPVIEVKEKVTLIR